MENRKRETLTPTLYQKAIRKRLNELRGRFSQSDMARAAKTPVTNVHRYLRVGKIPAEFCAALVESLEVNPAWLLAGEGGALLTDVDTGSAKVGAEMLGMVEAMNAVSRVRLGALAGRQQEQTLRELSDSVGAYDRIRERMNSTTRPVLTELIKRYRELTVHMELERAGNLRKACLQIAKFCDDDELLWQLDEQQAAHEHLMGRVDNALRFHVRLFARKLREGALTTPEAVSQAGSFVLALRDSGRFTEGRRICRAAIELTVEEGSDWFDFLELRLCAGSFDIELGELRSGLAQIQDVYSRLEGRQRLFSAIMLARAELLAGLCTVEDVRQRGNGSRGRARLLLRHGGVLENAAELKAICGQAIGTREEQVLPSEPEARRCTLLSQALSGRKGDYLAQFDALIAQAPPQVNSVHLKAVIVAVQRAQIARISAKPALAREAALVAQRAIDAVPKDLTVTIDLRALHARNLFALPDGADTREPKQKSRQFIEENIARGYAFLRAFKE